MIKDYISGADLNSIRQEQVQPVQQKRPMSMQFTIAESADRPMRASNQIESENKLISKPQTPLPDQVKNPIHSKES